MTAFSLRMTAESRYNAELQAKTAKHSSDHLLLVTFPAALCNYMSRGGVVARSLIKAHHHRSDAQLIIIVVFYLKSWHLDC